MAGRGPSALQLGDHSGGVAQPDAELAGDVRQQPHRDERLVVHCHHGGRSQRVTHYLRQQGFSQAQNMSGGIDDWSLKVDPAVPRYE